MLRIGYHVSISGGLELSFDRAEEVGCTSMQIFLGGPRNWNLRGISKDEIGKFSRRAGSADVRPVIVHMPYLPNLASPHMEIFEKSLESLSAHAQRCGELGIRYLVAHLGSSMGKGKDEGIRNVVNAINSAEIPKGVTLLMENQARHQNSVGASLEDLRGIYSGIVRKNVGFCIDTCHLFASGYDIRDANTVEQIDKALNTYASFAYILVSVPSRAELVFCIVYMEQMYVLQSKGFVYLLYCIRITYVVS